MIIEEEITLNPKMILKNIITIVFIILIPILTLAQTPINGGFEDAPNLTTNWVNPSEIGSYSTTTNPRTGTFALGYVTTAVASSATQSINPAVPILVPNQSYFHAIAWVAGNNAMSKISLGTIMGASSASGTPLAISSTYVRKSIDLKNVTGSDQNTIVRLRGATATAGSSTTIYVDDVIMYSDLNATTDLTKPISPTSFAFGTSTASSVDIFWVNGSDTGTGIQQTIILRTNNLSATLPIMNDQAVYSVTGGNDGPNIVSAEWNVISTTVNNTSTTFTDNTLNGNTSYKYAVIHRDFAWNYSTPLVSGVIKTPLNNAAQNIFSVIDFGADSTGVYDSSPAFQAALQALNAKGYGTFYMPKGVYLLNTQIGLNGSSMLFEIKGDGVNKTIIKCNNSIGGIRIYSANRNSQLTIHDFSMIPMLNNSGTAFEYSMLSGGNRENRSCIIENISIQSSLNNSFEKGMILTGHWRTLAKNISISGSPFSTTPVMTMGIDVTNSYTPRVINCTISNANEGILYINDAGQSGDFVGNIVSKCNIGIRLSELTGVQPHVNVESNNLDCFQYGLKIESRKIIFIKNNTFSNINATAGNEYFDIHISLTDGANQDVSDILVVNNTFSPTSNPKRKMIYLGNKVSNVFVRKNNYNSSGTEICIPNNSPFTVFEDNNIKPKVYFDEKFDSYNFATLLSDPTTNWFVNPNQSNGNAPSISTAIGFPTGTTKMATLQGQSNVVISNPYRMDGKKLSNEGVNLVGPQQVLYTAVLLKVNSIGTGTLSGSWFFSLGDSTFIRTRGKIYVVASGAGYKFAIAKGSDSWRVTDNTVRTFGSTQLLVVKYNVNSDSNTDDTVSVYINPNMANAEPISPSIIANNPNESSVLDFINTDIISAVLFQKGPAIQIGGIKVTNSWSELATNISTTLNAFNQSNNQQLYYSNGCLTTPMHGSLKVFSLQGIELFSGFTNGKIAIHLSNGVYITQFENEFGNVKIQKVLVEN